MKKFLLLAAFSAPGFIWAQAPEKNKEVDQIVITKKGAGTEKLNIVVDGDKVTVNGEPVDKNKEGNITVIRRKIKDADVLIDEGAPGERRIVRGYALGPAAALQPNKAMLGVTTMNGAEGVKVTSVAKGSAAEIAGLKEDDIILEIDRNKVEKPDDLSKIIRDKNPGDKITIGYSRDNKQRTAVAELKKWEAPEMPAFEGFNAQTLPGFDIEEFRSRLGDAENQLGNIRQFRALGVPLNRAKLGIKIQDVETGTGVKVIEVEEGSDAAKAGIKAGDIINEVEGKEVRDADDMRMKVINAKPGDALQLKLNHNGKSQNLKVQFSKKIKTADL